MKRIFIKLGIKEKLEVNDLHDILTEIKEKYSGKVLSKENMAQWKTDSDVIFNICDSFDEAFATQNLASIWLPTLNKSGKLQFYPTLDCFFDDSFTQSQRDALGDMNDDYPIVKLNKMNNI